MKTYVLKKGSKYILVEKTITGTHYAHIACETDLLFTEKELIQVDTVTGMLRFSVRYTTGNSDFFVNNTDVIVLN
jgi:hypothetical protein